MTTYTIDAVLLERDPGEWVAQCLQYDIGAQAGNLPDLLYELQRSIVGHMVIAIENGLEPMKCLSPAPQEYWDMWNRTSTYGARTFHSAHSRNAPRLSPPQDRGLDTSGALPIPPGAKNGRTHRHLHG